LHFYSCLFSFLHSFILLIIYYLNKLSSHGKDLYRYKIRNDRPLKAITEILWENYDLGEDEDEIDDIKMQAQGLLRLYFH